MHDPRDYALNHWLRYESDAEHAARVEAAEREATWHFDRATVRQKQVYREAVDAAVKLHGHGSMAHEATLNLAKAQWDRDTAAARDLFYRTCDELMTGEVSEARSLEWDALSAFDLPTIAERSVVQVGDHDPEIYHWEAA